jgi:glycerol-3-phosphate dehydrogenase
MAIHVDDVLVRRTGLFHELADQGGRLASIVVEAMGANLGWDDGRRAAELDRYRRIVEANRRWREGGHDDRS